MGYTLDRHFYIFGVLARILFQTYDFWIFTQDALFHWYFLLQYKYDIKQKVTPPDSTQSRD